MRIVAFQGSTQYDAGSLFVTRLAGAWRRAGHQVEEIELANEFLPRLAETIKTPCAFFFAYNGIGIDLAVGGKPLFDQLATPLVAWFVDHPCRHVQRVRTPVENLLIACVDRTHLDYLPSIRRGEPAKMFLPHFACSAEDADQPDGPRTIDLLMPGGLMGADEIFARWRQFPPDIFALCRDAADEALTHEQHRLDQVLEKVIAARGLELGWDNAFRLHPIADQVDLFVRSRRREDFLAALGCAGLVVDIYGNIHGRPSCLGGHRVHPPVAFGQMLKLMGNSRLVLNAGINFPHGAHERPLSAMLAGAVAVTEDNQFWRDNFADGTDHVAFRWADLEGLPDRLRGLLADEDRRRSIAAAGKAAVAAEHTADRRADQIAQAATALRTIRLIQPL